MAGWGANDELIISGGWGADDELVDESARRALPAGVKPNETAGAGRGGIGGPTADQLSRTRRGTSRGVQPYVAEEPTNILDRPAPGYQDQPGWEGSMGTDEMTPEAAKARAGIRPPLPEMRASPERGALARAADWTLRKPMDGSLGGLALEAVGDAGRGVVRASEGMAGSLYSAGQAGAEMVGSGDTAFAKFAGGAGKAARQAHGQMGNPIDRDSLTQQVFESTFSNLPIIGVLGAGNKALAAMGAMSAANDYGESRDAGKSHDQSLGRAAFMGIAEVVGERFGLPQVGQLFAKAAGRATTREMGHLLANILVKEQIGEQVTTALQDGYEKFGEQGRKPNMTLSDYLDDVANTAKVTLGQSLLMGAGAAGVRALPSMSSPERQIADAIDSNVAGTYFRQDAIDGFARRAATDPHFFTPGMVDPSATARAPSDVGPPAPPRVEDMPTTAWTPEQTAAMAAEFQARKQVQSDAQDAQDAQGRAGSQAEMPGRAQAAGASAPEALDAVNTPEATPGPVAFAEPLAITLPTEPQAAGQTPAAIGIRGKARGALAAEAEGLLQQNAQDAANEAINPVASQPAGAAPNSGLTPAANQALSPAGAVPTQPAVDAVPARQAGGAGPAPTGDGVSRISARYEAQRAALVGHAVESRQAAAQALNQGDVGRAEKLEKRAKAAEITASELPALEEAKDGLALQSFNTMADAFEGFSGRRPMAYVDRRSTASDGFFDPETGHFFVNLHKPSRSVAFTMFHEFQHVVRNMAEGGDATAQRATQMLDQVWAMIPQEKKQSYAQSYLFGERIRSGAMTLEQALASPVLRDEMLSDFMGGKADDAKFFRDLAAKDPKTFGAFAQSWIDSLNKLIKSLLGRVTGGNKDIEVMAASLGRSKLVAEKVLREWAAMNPKLAQEQGVNLTQGEQANSDGRQSGPRRSARMAYEVAPDPNDKEATAAWSARSTADKQERTYSTDAEAFDRIAKAIGVDPGGFVASRTLGGYMGEVNPSIVRTATTAVDADIVRMARALGYAYNQDSVLAVVRKPTGDSIESGSVIIRFDLPLTEALARQAYDAIRNAPGSDWIIGFTGRDTTMEIVNVGGEVTSAMVDGVRDALDASTIEVDRSVAANSAALHVVFVERGSYGQDAGSAAGQFEGDSQRAVDTEALDSIREEVGRAIGAAGATRRSGRDDAASSRPDRGLGKEDFRGPVKAGYGVAREGATAAVGYHFSQQDREALTSTKHGTGLAGAEAERLIGADPRLRERVYFYIDRGTGVNPESGVGGRAHRVELRNLYDADEDAQRLVRDNRGFTAFELAVVEAGFDGYLTRQAGPSGNAVLLGRHVVPTDRLGGRAAFKTEQPLRPAAERKLSAPERIAANRSLPAGATGRRWREHVSTMMPAEYKELQHSPVWDSDEQMYRDELARQLQPATSKAASNGDGAPALSRRRPAWAPDPNEDYRQNADTADQELESFGRSQALSQDDMESAQQELVETQGLVMERPNPLEYRLPSDGAIRAAGIMAEEAYRELPYVSSGGNHSEAVITFAGSGSYTFRLIESNGLESNRLPDAMSGLGRGAPGGFYSAPKGMGRAWNRRVAASIDLMKRGFDLFTAVPSAGRGRVIRAWKEIREIPGAAEFRNPSFDASGPDLQKLQEIADSMLAGSRYTATAQSGWNKKRFDVLIKDTKTGAIENAEIEHAGPDGLGNLVMHTAGFSAGSGMGKPFYQIAFAYSHAIGVKTEADGVLLGVNNYRRTEQMMSAAVRAGTAGAVNPGVGQRVYGWNNRPANDEQRDRNLARIALAAARNAAEFAPEVRDLSYDVAADTFSWRPRTKHDLDAEAYVRQALEDKAARKISLSRSTLARAAITFQAIDGTLDLAGITEVKSPILYSAREDAGKSSVYADEGALGDIDYKALAGRTIDIKALIEETGQTATFKMNAADYIRDLQEREATIRALIGCVKR